MATINAISASSSQPFSKTGSPFFVLENSVDFDDLEVASTDVVQVLPVWDGVRVLGVEVEIDTQATGTTATAVVGDGSDTDGFISSVNLKGSVGTVTTTEGAYASTRRYTGADTIDIIPTFDTVTVKGAVTVRAVCVQME